MDKDGEIKRLRRIIIRQNMFFMVVIVAVVVFFSIEARRLNNALEIAANIQPKVVNGINGRDGFNGAQGMPGATGATGQSGSNGVNGTNGLNVSTDQVASIVTAALPSAINDYLIKNPVKTLQGSQGIKGDAGQTLQLKLDPISCILSSKYDDIDIWTPIAHLSVPCQVSP